jgi:hypothetical protein
MAVTARRKPAPTAPPAPPCGHEDLAEVVTVLTRILCRLVVHASPGRYPASFREVAVQQARVASHAEIDAIEKYLSEHLEPR